MMRQVLFFLALIVVGVLVAVKLHEAEQLKEENRRLSVELAHAHTPLVPTVIRDSIRVVEQVVVEVDRKALKDALAAEHQLVKELQLKVKQLEAVQTTAMETTDSVPAQYQARDSIYSYHDQWADLRLELKDTTFYYNIRDSLSTLVYREYRHHFLWWKWGTRGYRLKIVNFNPHARVTYNRYIKAER